MALRCLGKHAAVLIKLVSSAKPQPSAVPPTTALGVICEMERFVGEKEGACAVLTSAVALEGQAASAGRDYVLCWQDNCLPTAETNQTTKGWRKREREFLRQHSDKMSSSSSQNQRKDVLVEGKSNWSLDILYNRERD